jgi:hypothetical protein
MVSKRSAAFAPRARALVLLDPRGAFASVALRPLWGAALLFMVATAILPPITYVAKGDVAAVVEREMKRSGKTDSLPEEQRANAVQMAAKVMKVALPIGASVKRGMWIVLLAGLAFALMRGSKPELRLEPIIGAVALAMAPLAVHDVLNVITFATKDVMTIDAQNAVLSNPAAWFGIDTAHNAAGVALKGLDFFDLWSCFLVGLGVNQVAGTRSSIPYALAFGLDAVGVGVAVLGAAMSS